MSDQIQAKVINLPQVTGYLDRTAREITTAHEIATRAEAFRLRGTLKQEIRAGAPGGQAFAPLSVIARRVIKGREKKPLERLAIPVRYWARRSSDGSRWGANSFKAAIGFTGGDVISMAGLQNSNDQLSSSWTRFAVMHQQGYSYEIPELGRVLLRRLGGQLKEKGWEGEARYYFLRKATRRVTVPSRPIINPFWQAHEQEAFANIRANFYRRLSGERI